MKQKLYYLLALTFLLLIGGGTNVVHAETVTVKRSIGYMAEGGTTDAVHQFTGYNDGANDIITVTADETAGSLTGTSSKTRNVTYNGKETKYSAAKVYRNKNASSGDVNNDSYDDNCYVGIKLVIADGYRIDVSQLKAQVGVSDDNFKYKIIVTDGTHNLYESQDKTAKKANANISTVTISSPKKLVVAGTVYLRMYFTITNGGTSKYIQPFELSLSGDVATATQYTINAGISLDNAGTVSGSGRYYENQDVFLNATSNSGYSFVNWTVGGNEVSTNASYSFKAGASDATYTANFISSSTYTITGAVADGQSSYGSITNAGTNNVNQGDNITLVATPNEGYLFVNWTKDGEAYSTDASITVTPTADATYVANFKKLYKVSYNLESYAGTITGKVLCNYNSDYDVNEIYADVDDKFTIPAYAHRYLYREGYTFAGWSDGNNTYQSGDVINGLTSDITLTPTWKATTQSLADSNAETVVTWSFAKSNLVFVDWQSNDEYGYNTETATVNQEEIAVPMKIMKGKVANYTRSDAIAQTNQNTTLTIPAVTGMKVEIADAYTNFSTTTIAGSTDYTGTGTKTIEYTYTGTDETIDIVIGESNQYLNSIKVTYPKVEQRTESNLTITSPTEVTLTANEPTAQITATTSATVGITYKSSNELIATVNASGLITAVANGTATITVSQTGDAAYQDDSKTVTVTVNNGVIPSYTVDAILNNETGSKLTSSEMESEGNVFSFGVNTTGERIAFGADDAVVNITGKFHDVQHGCTDLIVTVNATGNMKFTIGNCTYNNGTATLKDAQDNTIKTVNLSGTGCWKGAHTDITTMFYEGEATTLTLSIPSYCPYIKVESVGNIDKYTVTFMNGNTQVEQKQVIQGENVGALPNVSAEQGKRFRGWYIASDGSEGKVAVSTVPSSDVSYYAVFMDIPVATAGYYMPNNGLELANVLEYIEETSATSAKIFLKNGTYTLPRGASRHYTHKHSQTSAVLWDGDAYDPITYLKSSNVSFIGQSRDNVVITNNIPNTQEYIFSGQYGNANIYEGIGQSDVIQIDGNVSGLYWQDLTVSTGMEDGYGRDIAIQDRGTNNIYKNVSLHGYQDTWTSNKDNGLYYFEGGVVRGRTDYLCGKGDIYFNGVELRQLKGGYAAVPSKPASVGWVFKDCVINGDEADVDGNYTLGRPWGNGTPVAVFIDTKMNVKPSAIGWNEMSGGWPARFAEYNSFDANGNAISLTGRKTTFADTHQNNPVLTAKEAATYSDMTNMYGNWNPAQYTVQATVSNVKLNGSTLSWEGTSDAYLIEKNGEFVALTSEASYTVSGPGNYTVRAANARGGFGEPAESTAGKVTISYEIGTNTTSFTCTPSTTDDKITFAQVPYTLYADAMALDAKPNLSVKLNCGTADAAAATVTFAVPDGYAFIPYTAKAKVQPVTNNAMVKLTLSDDNNTMSNSAASFKQGSITTSTLTATETKYYTGTVTLSIYCYENGGKGYRLGTPITISGELVPVVKITPTGYATFSSAYPLDFTEEIEGLDAAYYASAVAKGSVTMTELKQTVPASTGLFLKGTPNATVYIPVAEAGTEINVTNYLKPNTTATEVAASTAGAYHYVFAYNNVAPYDPGFFNLGSSVNLGACKAYVETTEDIKPAAQAKVSILFMDAEPTGINDVRVTTPEAQGETYNLGGQRVGNGYKGIVIVNGKKVLK